MRRVSRSVTVALALSAALVVGASGSAVAKKPAGGGGGGTTGGALSVTLSSYAYDASSASCDLVWNFTDTTGKAVNGYQVAMSQTPMRSMPMGQVNVPGPYGYEVHGLGAGATSYFYVKAYYADGKTSGISSGSRRCN